jgi:hypothetical protein
MGMNDAMTLPGGIAMHCAHPGCKCNVEQNGKWGQYCSEHCQKAGNTAEGKCHCGHPNCA